MLVVFCRGSIDKISFEKDGLHRMKGLKMEFDSSNGMFGRYGCDSPYSLVSSLIQAILEVESNPDFVILNGDFSAHMVFDPNIIYNASMTVTKMLLDAYPHTQILPTVGNDDFYIDYNATCSDEIYSFYTKIWNQWLPSDGIDYFLQSGSYMIKPSTGLKIIVLNTILFAPRNINDLGADPCGVFAWLENELQDSIKNSEKVYLSGHIPPGTDSFSGTPLWKSNYEDMFYNITSKFPNIIAMFFGHIHREEFRIHENAAPIFIASSLSPVYLNNPSFRLFNYNSNSDFSLVNYIQYYMDLFDSNLNGVADWQTEYDFLEAYQVNDLSFNSVKKILNSIQNNTALYMEWNSRWTSQHDPSRVLLICAMMFQELSDFNQCVAVNTQVAGTKKKREL